MIMELPEGAVEIEVPENLKTLIPKNFKVEAIRTTRRRHEISSN